MEMFDCKHPSLCATHKKQQFLTLAKSNTSFLLFCPPEIFNDIVVEGTLFSGSFTDSD
jgi:hypothetical protein